MTSEAEDTIAELACNLENELTSHFGPMIYGNILYKSLGYSSADAFRQAVSRHTAPIDTFLIKGRRGRYALTRDVARWIAVQKVTNTHPTTKEIKP